jgi:hypothetical protein
MASHSRRPSIRFILNLIYNIVHSLYCLQEHHLFFIESRYTERPTKEMLANRVHKNEHQLSKMNRNVNRISVSVYLFLWIWLFFEICRLKQEICSANSWRRLRHCPWLQHFFTYLWTSCIKRTRNWKIVGAHISSAKILISILRNFILDEYT